jgi:signal transduction histidine kinase
MKTIKEKRDLLLRTHQQLLEAILHRGQNASHELAKLMSEDIQGFGSAKHEVFFSREEYMQKIFEVETGQMPAKIMVHYEDPVTTVWENAAIVHGLSEATFWLNGEEQRMFFRRTVVFHWEEDRWRAVHLHASEPSAQVTEGESWPLKVLQQKNEELNRLVDQRTKELLLSVRNLKATQAQLIQSEKMASLGELTAGIAHEIQNPLNFVNNFSEVNKELLIEMMEEIGKGNFREVKALAKDIIDNEEKINQHGKRADAIVKGMLQHSRSSAGLKEPTDINALADEYLRLAYHGLRAKDKSFNATLKTDYDENIGNINIIPQDIGRVILNLITNAFYAVAEQKKNTPTDYEPTVTVITKLHKPPSGGLGAMISVSDNGNGIPQKVLDKIFQPFFTTKPTGQGTGLGLSMSYDIVTKGHGGELTVKNNEGKGATFMITLPK